MLSSPRLGCAWGKGKEDRKEKGYLAKLRMKLTVQSKELYVTTLSQVYYNGNADTVISAARRVWLNSTHVNRSVGPGFALQKGLIINNVNH